MSWSRPRVRAGRREENRGRRSAHVQSVTIIKWGVRMARCAKAADSLQLNRAPPNPIPAQGYPSDHLLISAWFEFRSHQKQPDVEERRKVKRAFNLQACKNSSMFHARSECRGTQHMKAISRADSFCAATTLIVREAQCRSGKAASAL